MSEVGIYRISGVSGEIQRLKKAFEKSMTVILAELYVLCIVWGCTLKLICD